ncbi:MAG TPA: ATP-binding protein [Bryobacteraceae bacterium]|nr:ATP-binding protein [Bryobacteraceae bacterium]
MSYYREYTPGQKPEWGDFRVRELKGQFGGALLLVLTAAAVIVAVINFQQLRRFVLPDDGVTWTDRMDAAGRRAVVAAYVKPDSSGARAEIHLGDQVLRIGNYPINDALDVTRALSQLSIFSTTTYELRRGGIEFEKQNIVLGVAERDSAVYYEYLVGIAWLCIGLFVYYRRTNSPKALHFFLLCFVSFIASCFHYTGKLNNFDQVIYWGNIAASLFAPSLFLHFCLTFPDTRSIVRTRFRAFLLYVPATVLLALVVGSASGVLQFHAALIEVRWLLDRLMVAFFVAMYLLGAGALMLDYHRSNDPILRRQLKYLRNGALAGILPFAIFYAVPYVFGAVPSHLLTLSVVALGLIPVTWAYAITRYRLMDVDVIFQQGYVYTLSTLFVIGVFYFLIFFIGNLKVISAPAFVILILFATFVFQPIRRWLQEQLDRYIFYRDQYDYRLTLIEFARDLSSETNMDSMLASVADRLLRTLSIERVAFFLADEAGPRFRLHSTLQQPEDPKKAPAQPLDLSFLNSNDRRDYLFFERPRHLRDILSQGLPQSVRNTIAELDLTYYVACRSHGRTIAYLGVSRSRDGDFLSSDDVELLVTLSGYVAIAVENSRLYHSLQRKADEYERLKEFSENIVESISVGILAADLDDRVESWNSQIERLTGITRDDAVGRRLRDLFPADLCEKFEEFRDQHGIHNIYKFTLLPKLRDRSGQENGNGHLKEAAPRESVVNVAIAPLVSKDLEQIGRLIILDDVTDRDDLERRLVQADKLSSIGLLAAGVAHEVNTPLAVISTYAQMLAKQVSGDEQKSKLLEKIAKQTFRASEIVNSLLNFSRTGGTEFVDIDMNRVVKETSALLEHQLQKTGVQVRLNFGPNVPTIRGNFGKLQQVFLNLFLNARDAMPEGGKLMVRTWPEAGFVHVEVADTGHGISPDHLARIYDPFFTTKGARKGTGLGLSVSYGIVQEHNGIIEVDSRLGGGTRFRLEFPTAGAKQRPAAPPAREALSA